MQIQEDFKIAFLFLKLFFKNLNEGCGSALNCTFKSLLIKPLASIRPKEIAVQSVELIFSYMTL